MSPPPHQEGQDYMNSKPQRATKKKHHAHNLGSIKHDTSEGRLIPARSLVCSPAPMNDVENLSDAHFILASEPSEKHPTTRAGHEDTPASENSQSAKKPKGKNPPTVKSPQEVIQTAGRENPQSVASDESFRTNGGERCTSQDVIVGAGGSLNATFFSQTPPGENPKALSMVTSTKGLALPATINLRRATGFFQPSVKDDELARLPIDNAISTSCKLFAFTSEQCRGEAVPGTYNRGVRHSTCPSNGNDLMTQRNGQRKLSFPTNCNQGSLAEPAVTITSVLPSPAVLVTPTSARKSASGITEPERRFSVVQVKSRGSVTEVIWQEDESSTNSSCSDHSSRGVSPIDCTPRSGNTFGSPQQRPSLKTINDARDGSESTVCDGQAPSPHARLSENDDLIFQSRPKLHLQDAMLHWSWGEESGNTPMLQEVKAEAERPSLHTSHSHSPVLPQLLIPEEDITLASNGGKSIDRRGSSIDPASLGNIGGQREPPARSLTSALALHTFLIMAPDLNSVPPSPHTARATSDSVPNRSSELMAPPPNPSTSAANVSSVQRESATVDNAGVGSGPGPIRHPRPLTAADLHMQLEKEQEAVVSQRYSETLRKWVGDTDLKVNRLTRELSLLRQQTASVASTTSSTSTGFTDSMDHHTSQLVSGAGRPTPSRRHRSSSSLSTRSANTAATTTSGLTGLSGSTVGTTGGIAGSTVSGITPTRDAPIGYSAYGHSLSRQGSTASSRRSQASSPSLSSSLYQGEHFPNLIPPRQSSSSFHPSPQLPQQTMSPAVSTRSSYVPSSAATARYEEAAHHRSELEMVKRENDMLRRRIRELERSLSSHRTSLAEHTRSDFESTGVSVAPTTGAGAEQSQVVEEEEDTVHVGESAGSLGVGGGH
ncbi:MAG: hypothetical protein Q9167_000649 [Letrouitia subvulpina]